MSQYVWCEDSGAGLTFWKEIFGTLYPEMLVESKQNNSRLRRAVQSVQEDENTYYILLDQAIDNPDVLREVRKLNESILDKKNVYLINIHSFEFVLLSFTLLESWVFAEQDELKEKRRNLLAAKDLFIGMQNSGGDYSDLSRLKMMLSYPEKYNGEQLAARLLKDITKNTGFETDKRTLGCCFINDCCDWAGREENDKCGLDDERLTETMKKLSIVEHSVLKSALEEVGL